MQKRWSADSSRRRSGVHQKEEVTKALKKMKSEKAVGPDNIPIEVRKHTGDSDVTCLRDLVEKVLEEKTIPGEWRKRTLVLIYKNKDDILYCGKYRDIKLMSQSIKLLERVVLNRLRERVNISDEQFGLTRGRSTVDAMFALRQL